MLVSFFLFSFFFFFFCMRMLLAKLYGWLKFFSTVTFSYLFFFCPTLFAASAPGARTLSTVIIHTTPVHTEKYFFFLLTNVSAFGSQLTSSYKFKNGTFPPVGYFSALLEKGKDSSIPRPANFEKWCDIIIGEERNKFSRIENSFREEGKLSSFMQTVEKKKLFSLDLVV